MPEQPGAEAQPEIPADRAVDRRGAGGCIYIRWLKWRPLVHCTHSRPGPEFRRHPVSVSGTFLRQNVWFACKWLLKSYFCPDLLFFKFFSIRSVGFLRTSPRCGPSSRHCSATPSTVWRGHGRKCLGPSPALYPECCWWQRVRWVLVFYSLSFVCAHRESVRTFRELSEIFSDDNNYSLSRELLVKVSRSFSTAQSRGRRKDVVQQQPLDRICLFD